MDWTKGYSAEYYATTVDPVTWRDTERTEIIGGSVSRVTSDLRASASYSVLGYDGGEKWVRIWMDAKQGQDGAHVALFTGLATSPGTSIDGVVRENTIECYSVLKPAADVLLPRGWYAPTGLSARILLEDLLDPTPAPVSIDGDLPALADPLIAEDGETNLTMVDKILQAVGWRMSIDGDGTIRIREMPTEPAAAFDPIRTDVVEPEIEITRDWYSCPNVFRAVSGDLVGVARDDDPESPLSTVRRGREVWAEESGVDLGEGESIAAYALRMLEELQQAQTQARYNRRFMPDVTAGDLVRLRYPAQGLNGIFRVEEQNIELGYGARTAETVVA